MSAVCCSIQRYQTTEFAAGCWRKIPEPLLEHAVENVDALIRPPEDVFYKELDARYTTCAAVLTGGAQPRTLRSEPGRQASGAGLRLAARQQSRHQTGEKSASGGDHKCMAALCLSKRQQRRYSRLHLLHARSAGHRLAPSRCVHQAQLALC